MNIRIIIPLIITAVVAVVFVVTQTHDPREHAAAPTALSLTALLAQKSSGGGADFDTVLAPRPLRLPDDLGPHERFRHEWWYVTGNVMTTDQRHFGYQLTFFRFAGAPQATPGGSAWRSKQFYMAHLALTDTQDGKFYSGERSNRGVLDLAGAQARPFQVWLDDWYLKQVGRGALFPMRLHGRHEGIEISLQLQPGKALVLQGDRGFSRKGPQPGNASHYFSYTRVPTDGEIMMQGQRFQVTGDSWIDREWGTGTLGAEEAGWDWFGLQLDNGIDVMYFRLRQRDGTSTPFSAGSVIAPDGSVRPLSANDIAISADAVWRSAHTGITYPSAWTLRLPEYGATLQVTPVLAQQEHAQAITYWEGAVRVTGSWRDGDVQGNGYVELAGYGSD